MRADLGFGDRHGQRAAGPLQPLGFGAEGEEVAVDELPAAPDAGDSEQTGALYQCRLEAGDGRVVGRGFEEAGFPHTLDGV